MKKWKIGITVFFSVIITSINVFANDDFELRKGIRFGDTVDEVKQKETIEFEDLSEYGFEEKEDEEGYLIINTLEDEIMGIDGSIIHYKFKDGSLVDMQYAFGEDESSSSCNGNYDVLLTSLIKKYGNPIDKANKTSSIPITTSAIDDMLSITENNGMEVLGATIENELNIEDIDEWLLYYDNYGVKIDLVKFNAYYSFLGETKYKVKIGYRYIDEEELNNYVNDVIDYNNELENDL